MPLKHSPKGFRVIKIMKIFLYAFLLLFSFQPSFAQEDLSSLKRPDRKIAEPKNDRKTIKNFTDWADTDGNYITAHAGSMLKVGDTYYWYGGDMGINPTGMFNQRVYLPGEDPKTWKRFFDGYSVYTSKDLTNWEYRGKAMEAPEKGFMSLYITSRPHIIYNDKTKKYVMYHYYYPIYPGCLLMVATSDSPLGPFVHQGVVEAGSPNGHVGDLNVFKDKNGDGYVIYDDTGFDIRMDKLTGDYLSSKKDGVIVMDKKQESPAMVRYKGKYIIAGSGVDGFNPSEVTVVYADKPMGPYSEKQVVSENKSWSSQITDMIVIPEADYILVMFDQWFIPDNKTIDRSHYLWLPMEFDPKTGKAKIHYMKEWDPMDPFGKKRNKK